MSISIMLVISTFAIVMFSSSTIADPELENINVIINPSDDAYIIEKAPYNNTGDLSSLVVRNGVGGYLPANASGWTWDSLVRFNLSSIPSNAVVSSATLNLYYYNTWDNDPTGRVLSLVRLTDGWSEDSVTWASQPGEVGNASSFCVVPGNFSWMSWDVTGDVQGMVGQYLSNYGWKVSDDIDFGMVDIPIVCFYSKDGNNSGYLPYLEIDYELNGSGSGGGGGPASYPVEPEENEEEQTPPAPQPSSGGGSSGGGGCASPSNRITKIQIQIKTGSKITSLVEIEDNFVLYFEISDNLKIEEIDKSSIVINDQLTLTKDSVDIVDCDNDGIYELKIKIQEHQINSAVKDNEETNIKISGKLNSNTNFEGSQKVKIDVVTKEDIQEVQKEIMHRISLIKEFLQNYLMK